MPYAPAEGFTAITTIDAHTGGEPLRIIVAGWNEPHGATMLEKRAYVKAHCDTLRTALMWEPRGHADMYGCLPTKPVTPDGDVGVLFMHNEGYSTMCGHGIIALVKVGLEYGLFQTKDNFVRIDTPAGRVTAKPHFDGRRVASVSFRNVPSFVMAHDVVLNVPGVGNGQVTGDIAFGGAFYVYVDGAALGLHPKDARTLIDVGMRIKRAAMDQVRMRHPHGDPELEFVYGTIFVWEGPERLFSTNVCVFADGEVDRCPTGTGVSGRAAIAFVRGQLQLAETMTIESITGSRFDVAVAETTRVGLTDAVVPEVTGTAFLTGRHEFWIDPSDPFRDGFLVRR